ncbi:MAG: hypothetical protein ACOVOV_02535 [Dolichospermum sp.]
MKGRKNPATAELKHEFLLVKKLLPRAWKISYIIKHHSRTRGIEVVNVLTRLDNIQKGKAAPTPSELSKIKQLLP